MPNSTCPHCQKELPENYGALDCPFCGKDLPGLETTSPVSRVTDKINWLMFWMVLFAPAICCFLALTINLGDLAVLPGLFGGTISGLICASMIMRSVGLAGFQRAAAHFGLAMALCCLSYFLCFAGCMGASTISGHGI